MSIVDRALSVAGTARTFAANFWPWLLGAFLLGGLVVAYPTFAITRAVYQRATLQCRAESAQLREGIAVKVADGEVAAAARQAEALEAFRAGEARKDAAVSAIPEQVAALLAPKFSALRESLNAPEFDCLRHPLPAPALRLLERPGGIAPATR